MAQLEVNGEEITVSSTKEALEYVALFVNAGTARLRQEREMLILGWSKWSEVPVVLDRRRVDMFNTGLGR